MIQDEKYTCNVCNVCGDDMGTKTVNFIDDKFKLSGHYNAGSVHYKKDGMYQSIVVFC